MSKLSKIFAINLVAIALAACGNAGNGTNDQAPAPAPATESIAVPTPATVVEPTMENLLGTYSGTLPCGDCKGVITNLELLADGTYKLNETYDGKVGDGSVLDSAGYWAVDLTTKRLTLDPAAKAWEDRTFNIVSAGHIRPLDIQGNAYSAEGLNDLRAGL